MRTEIITCDDCGAQISVVHRHGTIEGEYCYECLQKLIAPVSELETECPHEDNASDEAAGKTTARLVCKKCGFDRVVPIVRPEVLA